MGQLILPKVGFEDVENQQDTFSSLKPTASQAMGSFYESIRDTMSGPFLRRKELNSAGWTPFGSERDYVDPKVLNEQYGLEGLDFSKVGPRTDAQAKLMYNNKLAEIERSDRRERAQGWATTAFVAQDLVAGMADPIGLGIGFAIAPARLIPGLKNLSTVADDVGAKFIQRGSAAFVTSTVNGAAGMSLVEPYNLYMHEQMQDDYTMANSLASIAFGGLAGGALHTTGLGLYKAGQYVINGLHQVSNTTPNFMNKIDTATHELALDARIKQIMTGDESGVESIVRADKNLQAEAQVSKILEASKNPTIDLAELQAQIASAETSLGVKLPPEVAKLILGRKSNIYSEGVDLQIPVIKPREMFPISGPLGSNDGGVFTLADGSKVYAKFPANPEHAKVEVAAHILYAQSHKLAGETSLPAVQIIKERGQIKGIATRWIDGLRPISPKELTERLNTVPAAEAERIRQLGGSWVFDAWMGNRDVYGMGPTWNIFTDDNGNYFKMDFGGSLDMRAQGGPKYDFGTTVSELDSFQHYAGKELIAATKEDEAIGVEMVLRMSKEDIRSALLSAGFEGKRLEDLAAILLARQDYIRGRYSEVAAVIDGLYNNKTHAGTVEVARAWLEERAEAFDKSNPTAPELKALKTYLTGFMHDTNAKLWNEIPLSDTELIKVDLLDGLIQKQPPLEQRVVVYRWFDMEQLSAKVLVTEDNIKELLEKTAYPHKGYLSTSPHPDTSIGGRDVLFKLEVEPGVKGLPMEPLYKTDGDDYADELEFLISRNQLLVVDTVNRMEKTLPNGNTQVVHVVNAKVINPETLHKDAGELAASVRSLQEGPQPAKLEDTFEHPAAKHITALVDEINAVKDDLYAPVLTDRVETKTKLMLETEREISELQASMSGLADDLAPELKEELAIADENIKKTNGFADAMKQAWACYKGL